MSWKHYFKIEQMFSTSLMRATFFIWIFLVYCWWSVSFANSKKSKSLFVILFSGRGGYVSSVNAFLFSLKNKDNLEPFKAPVYQYSDFAMRPRSNSGPTFGRGYDLYISNNANITTSSYANLSYTYQPPPGYSYNATNTKALLVGTEHFTPSDVEVLYLQHSLVIPITATVTLTI